MSLTPFGAPGCTILASGEIVTIVVTSASGSAAVTYAIPNDTGLLGAAFYNQFLIQDPTANLLGFVTSNGGKGVIGSL